MIWKRWHYGVAALLVLSGEVAIALWVDDGLVRPYAGDSLAVVLVYLATRAATRLKVLPATGFAAGVAVAIELAQGLHLLRSVGLEGNVFARTVLGGKFDPADFAAYAVGAGVILLAESALVRRVTGR